MMQNQVTHLTLTVSLILMLTLIFSLSVFSEETQTVTREQVDEWMIQAGESYAQEKYVEAIELYTKAADHGNAWGQNNLAWMYATLRDEHFRNGELAVKYALKAAEQEPQNGFFVRTLAAAYARNEQFGQAVETQTHAMELFSENSTLTEEQLEEFRQDHQEKLALYEYQQAYVDDK